MGYIGLNIHRNNKCFYDCSFTCINFVFPGICLGCGLNRECHWVVLMFLSPSHLISRSGGGSYGVCIVEKHTLSDGALLKRCGVGGGVIGQSNQTFDRMCFFIKVHSFRFW